MAKDHYVPQFYLRNFQIPNKQGWIYTYARKRKPIPRAIRSIAFEDDYYDRKTFIESEPVDVVDKLLKLTEDTASPIITKLLGASTFSLTGEEFGYFIWFVALLAFRTPFARESAATVLDTISRREFRKFVEDRESFLELARKHQPETSINELEEARQAFLNGDIEMNLKRGGETEDYLMRNQLELADKVVDYLQHKYWHIVESDCSRVFLTSDHPVVLMPSPLHRPGMPIGYTNGHMLLPLSPRRALLLTNKRITRGVISVNREKMEEYQWYTIMRCFKYVYSHLQSQGFQLILDSTEEGHIIIGYKPNE